MSDLELKMHVRQALDASMPLLLEDPNLTDKVLTRHAEKRESWRPRSVGLRVAAALAVMLLVVCGGLLSHVSFDIEEWISNDQYGEWHHFQAVNINTPTVGTAKAAVPFNGKFSLSTEDWDEFVSALGWMPRVPAWLPDGWASYSYQASDIELWSSSTLLDYCSANDSFIVITQRVFRDLEFMQTGVHQDEEGESITLKNGVTVYLAPLGEGYVAYWIEDIMDYTMYAPCSREEVLHIVNSMYGLD